MFFQVRDGVKVTVGEGFQCWIPPAPKDTSQIINYGLPIEEQYWQREPIPKWYLERSLEEEYKQSIDRELILKGKKKTMFIDPMCERYRRREWHRRTWGVHIMINGECVYLTNHHYFYLQLCKFDHKENDGYPFYYEFSRDSFYIRSWCENNPRSLGYLFIAARGTGKTNEELACIVNRATMYHNHRAALQSNDFEVGAKGVLIQAKTVPLFNALPKFFKPEFAHGTNTQSELVFRRRSISGKASTDLEFGPDIELLSTIFAVAPGEKVLDKETLGDALEDEVGKCLVKGTKVLMFDGSIKEVQDIKKDDLIMGDDSTSRKVLKKFSGEKLCYDIIPNKGETWACTEDHVLSLKWCYQNRRLNVNGKIYQKGDTVNIPVNEYLKLHKTAKRHLMLYRVGVEYPEVDHVIDPYILGLWLGDGSKNKFKFFNNDIEIIDYLVQYINTNGYEANVSTGRPSVKVVTVRKDYHNHLAKTLLKELQLKNNKHIPNSYLVDSRSNRLRLLAGLIDTDGNLNANGNKINFEITQKLEVIARGIHTLANSLGFYCSINEKMASMKRKDGTVYRCKVYRLNIFGSNLHEIPCLVKRKKAPKVTGAHKNTRNTENSGFKVVNRGIEKYYGFHLDRNSLFLLSDFTVTHNCDPKKVADVYVRHETNLKTVFRNHRKIGMLRKTTTVEEMNEGGDECHKLWKDSDMKTLDGNGFTTSKIHRHLISSLDTDTSLENYIDAKGKNYGPACNKYGRVNREIANIKIQNDFDALKSDLKKLGSRMRKSPRNETEAFIKDQSKSIFNVMLLSNRLEKIRNHMPKPPYVRGNLYWVKDKFGPVWWERDDHAGRFNWAWFPDEFSRIKEPDKAKILNNFGEEWGYDMKGFSRLLKYPKNDHLFRIGSDPIKYSKTKDPRASKAAVHGFRLFDGLVDYQKPKDQWTSHNFIFEYINRPEDPETTFEDTAMACMFLGCKLLPERNVPSLNAYFEANGLEKFLAYPKDFISSTVDLQVNSDDAGYASTSEVIDYYTRRLIAFINNHIDRMPFDNTIEDWLNFDSTNPTKSDATVSSGFTLVHAEKIAEVEQPTEGGLSDWFETYDNSSVNGTFAQQQETR